MDLDPMTNNQPTDSDPKTGMESANLKRTLKDLARRDPKGPKTLKALEKRVQDARQTLMALAWGSNTEGLESAASEAYDALGAFTWADSEV